MIRRSSKLFDFPSRAARLELATALAPKRKDGGANRDRTDDLKLAKLALSQLSYGPVVVEIVDWMVGLGRLELPTSRLSSARSNQLSYKPDEAASQQSRGFISTGADGKGRETKAAARRQLSNVEVRGGS